VFFIAPLFHAHEFPSTKIAIELSSFSAFHTLPAISCPPWTMYGWVPW
jgi:hypothetical protein